MTVQAAVMTLPGLAMLWLFGLLAGSQSHATDVAPVEPSSDPGERDWTINDSIAVRYVVEDQELSGELLGPHSGNPIEYSPSGEHFFFMTRRGDLSCDCVSYELQVFGVNDIRNRLASDMTDMAPPLSPRQRVTMNSARSEYSYAGVSSARWVGELSVAFLGVKGEGNRSVYQLDVNSGKLQKLTDSRFDVMSFTLGENRLIFRSSERKPYDPVDIAYPAYPITPFNRDTLFRLLSRHETIESLYVSSDNDTASQIAVDIGGIPFEARISPDGEHAIMVYSAKDADIPASWRAYRSSRGYQFRDSHLSQFMLVDLENGKGQPVVKAPTGYVVDSTQLGIDAFWAEDSSRVILVNTALPLDTDQEERRSTAYIVDFELSSGRWSILEPIGRADAGASSASTGLVTTSVNWIQKGREVLVRHATVGGESAEGTVYTLERDGWVGRTVSEPEQRELLESHPSKGSQRDITVEVRQTANDPPIVVATDGRSEVALMGSDPSLEGIWRSPMNAVHWREGERIATGGLMLPRDFMTTKPVPLVIQVSYYVPNKFLPDGTSPTGYAAQPLVSSGMAVLQVDMPLSDRRSYVQAHPSEEGRLFVERIDAAVDSLAARGLIDPRSVGLIGYSRAGFNVYHAITHPGRTKIAAAVIADGGAASYGNYIMYGAATGRRHAGYEPLHGGGTFWENKLGWLERAPAFNVDHVSTPALFTTNGTSMTGHMSVIERLAAFYINRKPVEYLIFPQSSHQLQRPRERLTSLQATVDWMAFWLMGRLPEDKETCERWVDMKTSWERRAAEDATDTLTGESS